MEPESDVVKLADLTELTPPSNALRNTLLRRSISTLPADITYSAFAEQLDNLRLAVGQTTVRQELHEAIVRHFPLRDSEARISKGNDETGLVEGKWYQAIIWVRHAGVFVGDMYRPAFETETIATFQVLEISHSYVRITWQPVEGKAIRLGTYGARVSVPLQGELPTQLDLEQATTLVDLTYKLRKREEEEKRTAQLNAIARAEKERQLQDILQRLSPFRQRGIE